MTYGGLSDYFFIFSLPLLNQTGNSYYQGKEEIIYFNNNLEIISLVWKWNWKMYRKENMTNKTNRKKLEIFPWTDILPLFIEINKIHLNLNNKINLLMIMLWTYLWKF